MDGSSVGLAVVAHGNKNMSRMSCCHRAVRSNRDRRRPLPLDVGARYRSFLDALLLMLTLCLPSGSNVSQGGQGAPLFRGEYLASSLWRDQCLLFTGWPTTVRFLVANTHFRDGDP